MKKADRINRCKGRTKQGKPCQAAATAGGLCFFHSNPDKASELGRKGGRMNRRWVPPERDALPRLDNTRAIRDTVDRLISETYMGRLDPKTAAGLERLLYLQLRTLGSAELEQRVAALERDRMETETKDTSAGSGVPSGRRSEP